MKQRILFLSVLAVLAASARAAPPHEQAAAEAPEPAAAPYESAFAGYRRYEEREIATWRELNDEVARLGGGHAHMRGAPEPNPSGEAKPTSPPSGHRGMDHGGHR